MGPNTKRGSGLALDSNKPIVKLGNNQEYMNTDWILAIRKCLKIMVLWL